MIAMKVNLRNLDKMLLGHAKKILGEALQLRKEMISYRVLIKKHKPAWEREAYELLKEYLGDLALLGKDLGLIGNLDAEWLCICDLFDGSLNFMCGLKYYAYSLALLQNREAVYGFVVDLDKMTYYRAEKGGGAYIVRPDGVISELREEALRVPANFQVITTNVIIKGLNSTEFRCTALELCALARGAAEIGIGRSWTPEVAAGYVILREAGFEFTDWDFRPINRIPLTYEEIKFVSGSPKTIKELHAKIKSVNDIIVIA